MVTSHVVRDGNSVRLMRFPLFISVICVEVKRRSTICLWLQASPLPDLVRVQEEGFHPTLEKPDL